MLAYIEKKQYLCEQNFFAYEKIFFLMGASVSII